MNSKVKGYDAFCTITTSFFSSEDSAFFNNNKILFHYLFFLYVVVFCGNFCLYYVLEREEYSVFSQSLPR